MCCASSRRTWSARSGCEVLVNNAGMSVQAEFMRQSPDARRAEMELNYFGAQRVAAAVLPGMLRRGRGKIVNVSSLLGYVACPTNASYCASKAALNAWSRALHLELKRFGVDVQLFVAPHTQTALGDATRYDGVRKLPAAYVAAELATAIAGRRREYAASPVYRMLLQMARFFPSFIEARVASSTRSLLASSWDPNAPA
jgi:short-subunit dehydrogenase